MRYECHLTCEGNLGQLLEAIPAFYLGEGFELRNEDGDVQRFFRRGASWRMLTHRIETLPIELEIEVLPNPHDDAVCRLVLRYRVRTGWRLVSRIDRLFFRLQVQSLERYLRTGVRIDPRLRLDQLRGPVAAACTMNLGMSTVMIAVVGVLSGFALPVTFAVALIVAIVNLVSIIGFTDVVIEGMENIQEAG